MDLNIQGGLTLQVSDTVFGVEYKESLIHQVVTAYMAGARAGTKAQKNRSDVSGGGIKPFKQKGTGRARQGSTRSPQMRHGGRAFAARPRNFEQKVNRKMYQGAMRSILSELLRQGRLVIVDAFGVDQPKTKLLVGKLNAMDIKDVLLVTHDLDDNLWLAARNLYHVGVRSSEDIDPVSLVGYEKVLMTKEALKQIEERLS